MLTPVFSSVSGQCDPRPELSGQRCELMLEGGKDSPQVAAAVSIPQIRGSDKQWARGRQRVPGVTLGHRGLPRAPHPATERGLSESSVSLADLGLWLPRQ